MRDEMNARWLPAGVLAKELGIYVRWVYRQVKVLDIHPSLHEYDGVMISCYPPGTLSSLEVLLDEKRFRDEYRALPNLLSIGEIAEVIGRSYVWTAGAVKQLQSRPSKVERRGAFQTHLYPRRLVLRLRERLTKAPIAEFELNMLQLVELTGNDREWIENRLRELGLEPRLMRSPLTGRFLWYYPANSVDALKEVRRVSGARPGWLTAEAIEKQLGKSSNWVRRRLRKPEMTRQAELMADSQLVPRLHYPPAVIEQLRAELEEKGNYPEAGDHLPLYLAAKQLGRSKLWVTNRVERYGFEMPLRINAKGRLTPHLSPEVMLQLQNLSEQERSAKG